ncbi:hypothetical protein HDU84_003252 [Entophlyctis sp. JEL0112]|nr:hypothetical protein HDU84_003252 [Entophlyctis sp. JEL0112]
MVVRASEVESITARLRSLAPSAGGTATLDALCALSALLDRLDTSPPPSTSMLRSQLVPASLLVPALQSLQHITSVPESLSDEDASLCSRIIGELQQSFCLLRSSKKLRQLAQTSLEQAALLCVEACETTSAVLARLPSQTILSFAADVLLETSSVIHTVANSKKTFQTVVSKLLAPLMKLNDFVISQCSNSNSKFSDLERLESALDQLISSTIFHKDQILDYISALQVVVGKPQNTKDSNSFALWCLKIASNIGRNKTMKASYQMQFFDQVAELLKAENCECFLSTLPHLLELFIKSRKLHMKSHDSNFSFNVDFAVFLVLFSLVISSDANISKTQEVQLPDMLLKLAESRALGNERRASAISGMVKVLAKMEVYRATQDEVSRMQFWALETICAAFVRFLVEPQSSKTQEYFESITFEIATSLLEIEHSIVADSMEDLMSTAVLPRQKTRRSALQFAICLMNSLSRSRELETFFEQVFRSLKNSIIENCGTCVFLDKAFLKEFVLVSPFMNRLIDALRELLRFSSSVSKTLPTQITNLLAICVSHFQSTMHEFSGRYHRDEKQSSNKLKFLVLSAFVSHIVPRAAEVFAKSFTKTASEALEASLDDIFTKVVAPLVQTETDDATKDGKRKSDWISNWTDTDFNLSIVGLEILLVLMQSSPSFWRRNIQTQFVLSLIRANKTQASESWSCRFLKVRISLLHAESLASSSLDPKVEPGCVELVEEVFDWVWPNVIQPEISSTWDGQASSLDRNSFGVAVWACISDHLIPICQLLPKERTKAIVEWFASSLGNGNIASNSDISYYSVSVFQRISGSLLKGSTCSPEEYLVKTNSVIAELTSDKAFHFEVLTCLIRSLVSSPVFKKRSALPMITADADSRASVLENIDIMNCLSPVIIEAENEVLAELLPLHGDIARKFANANFLENIMSALGLFEQLLDFKACYILEKSSSVEEMFKSAEKFLKYMSDNVSVFSEEHVTELGAKLLSLQLNRLKNLESIESEVAKDSFISGWKLTAAAWHQSKENMLFMVLLNVFEDSNAVTTIHNAVSSFLQTCSNVSIMHSVLEDCLNLLDDLLYSRVDGKEISAALFLLVASISGFQKSGRRGPLRKLLQRIILTTVRVIDGSLSVDLTIESFVLLTRLCEDRSLEINRADVAKPAQEHVFRAG